MAALFIAVVCGCSPLLVLLHAAACWPPGNPDLRRSMYNAHPQKPADAAFEAQLRAKIDGKTKPHGALGQLERIAFRIGRIQRKLSPVLEAPHIVVFAADHGIAREGTSAYPPEVTRQMVLNFLQGGAAINVFCARQGIALSVVDAGVDHDFAQHPGLIVSKLRRGTDNMLHGPAMDADTMDAALASGKRIVNGIVDGGCNIIGFGEMGIGNTSAASLITARMLQLPVTDCVGRGTGLDAEQLAHKTAVLERVSAMHATARTPSEVLRTMGGLEIAQICGGMLAAYERGITILVDGFITTAALLLARAETPDILDHCIFSHRSSERAHAIALQELGAEPILHLDLRLGEGSACALAYPIVQSAVDFLCRMASFEEAAVSTAT